LIRSIGLIGSDQLMLKKNFLTQSPVGAASTRLSSSQASREKNYSDKIICSSFIDNRTG
jgi:hypothetical protein